ncbi:GNAT family N-acetyltransferase [Methylomonas sp. ZR1]|uniref:GNAT family N-acetyltransferase n=1 Tax=Methylomonas sp. ZR1 TaxID=1797072 RepID=UPI001492465E|nr:GNAT family N-acetyltransferase [Methylomonas sp. ZR1]NOV28682.1 GNAT family N-acetyltransferase [Methylomonas sp. ZR1]
MQIANCYLEPASYAVDFEDICYVRNLVFVVEQQIPLEVEFDKLDADCHHFLVRDADYRPIATCRLSPEGKLGRMAVLLEWRGQGVGESLLRAAIDKARNLGLTTITANAQLRALGFYQKFGFVAEGEGFAEAGIPHQAIRLILQPLEQTLRSVLQTREVSVDAVRLETVESTLTATRQLVMAARRQICIYSRDLDFVLYGQKDLVEALKQFTLGNRNASVQIIVQEPASLRHQVHPIVELAQRLPSYFLIRVPDEAEDLQYPSAFIINDSDGYLFRLLGNRYDGHWSPNLPARHRPLREEFERVWQRSSACAEFRALSL